MSCLAYRNRPAGDGWGDSTGSADGAGTGLWPRGVWCKESILQHVLKRTQHTHMCLCGLKDHYGGVHDWVGEHDGGEGETDWSRADTAAWPGEETERNGIWIGEECELWGCQSEIMRWVCNTQQPGTNENALTSAQYRYTLCQHRQDNDNVSMDSDPCRAL